MKILIFVICVLFLMTCYLSVIAQEVTGPHEIRWIRVGKLHSWFSNAGAEVEYGRRGRAMYERFDQADQLYWDAQYSYQDRCCSKAMWIGATNFYDPVAALNFPYKTVLAGPYYANTLTNFIPVEFKMIGRFRSPSVFVDGRTASDNDIYDILTEIDPDLKADRMIITKLHSNIGVTVTRKVLKFSQQNHDDYFIYDYVFKNTGIYDLQKDPVQQTLTDVFFHFQFRYAPGFESYIMGFNTSGTITWGKNTVSAVVGQNPDDPDFEFRAFYSYYAPSISASSYEEDWGAPDRIHGGALGAPAFLGVVTLHADKSPTDHGDDLSQPTSTQFIGADQDMFKYIDPYDQTFMQIQYELISAGHPAATHAEAVDNNFPELWGTNDGGYYQTLGFGPYTLKPGDSIHIALAEAVNGLSREKSIEIGNNWFSNAMPFTLPDGNTTSERDIYKKAWVWTARDSLFETFRRAIDNYKIGYDIPQPPPPPEIFEVRSSSDRIHLIWSNNAESWPNFNGYQIFRAKHRPDTTYEQIFSCDKENVVNQFDDVTAVPYRLGINSFYYYIQTKDDGSTNDVHPGTLLPSCKFHTMTRIPVMIINTGMEELTKEPISSFRLEQNYPNPFNPATTICYELPEASRVILKIYDILDREIQVLVNEQQKPGRYAINFYASNLSSGVYFYKLQAGEYFVRMKKMLLLK